jgi:DNA-binding XRE family transcriptional regulator
MNYTKTKTRKPLKARRVALTAKTSGKWREGSVQEFLGLSAAEMELIEIRLTLSRLLKEVRQKQALTQMQVAAKIHTSQSRLAKMEAGDSSVSLDLLIKSVFTLGVSRRELASVL